MTAAEVTTRLIRIWEMRGDDESAHGEEDALRRDVLQAIADGAENAQDLAVLALVSEGYDFARWCA